ncbi:MAG: hypothetical protein ACYCSN_12975 [Acidobacteriaceae bacterium]
MGYTIAHRTVFLRLLEERSFSRAMNAQKSTHLAHIFRPMLLVQTSAANKERPCALAGPFCCSLLLSAG